MSFTIYNVLNRKKEEFVPIEDKKVKMYGCGITVSNSAHVGHAYQAVIFDVLYKYLTTLGYDVTYVRNYTDIDDKIIKKANELHMNPLEYAEKLIAKTNKEMDLLGVRRPDIEARVTKSIPEIIDFIEKLIEKGYAYSTSVGNVYFKVNSFPSYGSFSNREISNSISGVRKEIEEDKIDDRDFALWKKSLENEIYWNSPWGRGRPGWHIECSAMNLKYFGEKIDIHGGGRDLLFPHHENEIAQTEALTGKRFANYWVHNGLVKINGEKMSKSLGNSILLEDLLKEYNTDVIRVAFLQNHYRSDLNITDELFSIYEEKVYQLYKLFYKIEQATFNKKVKENKNSLDYKKIQEDFLNAMNNDLNTSLVIANLFGYIKEMTSELENNNLEVVNNKKSAIQFFYNILGITNQNPLEVINQIKRKYLKKSHLTILEIEEMLKLRNQYKIEKNFKEADKIQKKLIGYGITINDRNDFLDWDIHFKSSRK